MAPSASMAKRPAEDVRLDPSPRPSKRVHQERIEYHDLDTRMNMMTEQIKELNESLGREQGYRRDMQIYLTRIFKEQIEKEVKEAFEDIKRELKREQKCRDDKLAKDTAQKAAEGYHKQLRDELMSMVANHKKAAEEVQQRNEEKQMTLETKNQNILNELRSLSSMYETTVKTIAQHAQEAQQDHEELQKLRDENQQIRNQHDTLLTDSKTAHDLVSQEAQKIRNDLEELRTKSQEACNKIVKDANEVILNLQKDTKDLKTANIMLHNKQTALDNKCQLLEEKNSRLEKLHSNAALTHVSPNSHVTPATVSYPSPGSETMQQQSFGSSTTSVATTTTVDIMDQTPNQLGPEETMHDVSDGDISGDEKPAERMSVPPLPMDIDPTNNTPSATGYSASSSGSFGKPSMPLLKGPQPPTGPSAQAGVQRNHVRAPQPTLRIVHQSPVASAAPTQPSFPTEMLAAPAPAPVGSVGTSMPRQFPIPPPPSAGRPHVPTTSFTSPMPTPQRHFDSNARGVSYNPPTEPLAMRKPAVPSEKRLFGTDTPSPANMAADRELAALCRTNCHEPLEKERSASPIRGDRDSLTRARSPDPFDRRRSRESAPSPGRGNLRGNRERATSPGRGSRRGGHGQSDTRQAATYLRAGAAPAGFSGIKLSDLRPAASRNAATSADSSADKSTAELNQTLDKISNESLRNNAKPAASSSGISAEQWEQSCNEILNEEPYTTSQSGDNHDPYAEARATNNEARTSRRGNDHSRRSNAPPPVPRETIDRRAPTTINGPRTNRRSNDQSRRSNVLPSNRDRRPWSTNNEPRPGRRDSYRGNRGSYQSKMMSTIGEEEEGVPVESVEENDDSILMSENSRGKQRMPKNVTLKDVLSGKLSVSEYKAYIREREDVIRRSAGRGKPPMRKSDAPVAPPVNEDDEDDEDNEDNEDNDDDEDDEDDDDDEDDAHADEEGAAKYGNMSSGETHHGQSSATRRVLLEETKHISQPHEANNPMREAEDDFDYEDGPEVLHT